MATAAEYLAEAGGDVYTAWLLAVCGGNSTTAQGYWVESGGDIFEAILLALVGQ